MGQFAALYKSSKCNKLYHYILVSKVRSVVENNMKNFQDIFNPKHLMIYPMYSCYLAKTFSRY